MFYQKCQCSLKTFHSPHKEHRKEVQEKQKDTKTRYTRSAFFALLCTKTRRPTKQVLLYSTVMKFCSSLTAHQHVDEDIAATTHYCSYITQEQHIQDVFVCWWQMNKRKIDRSCPQSDVRLTLDDSFKFIIERVWLGLCCEFPSWKPKYASYYASFWYTLLTTQKSCITGQPHSPAKNSLKMVADGNSHRKWFIKFKV